MKYFFSKIKLEYAWSLIYQKQPDCVANPTLMFIYTPKSDVEGVSKKKINCFMSKLKKKEFNFWSNII